MADGPQKSFGRFEEVKNPLLLAEIEPRLFGLSDPNLLTTLTGKKGPYNKKKGEVSPLQAYVAQRLRLQDFLTLGT